MDKKGKKPSTKEKIDLAIKVVIAVATLINAIANLFK